METTVTALDIEEIIGKTLAELRLAESNVKEARAEGFRLIREAMAPINATVDALLDSQVAAEQSAKDLRAKLMEYGKTLYQGNNEHKTTKTAAGTLIFRVGEKFVLTDQNRIEDDMKACHVWVTLTEVRIKMPQAEAWVKGMRSANVNIRGVYFEPAYSIAVTWPKEPDNEG